MTEKDEKQPEHRRYPSLVWPIILITVGVLFLLSNLGVFKDVNFGEFWRLWPVLLILFGLEILVGRRSVLGNVIVLIITIAVVAGVVILLVSAPEVLGRPPGGAVHRINEPLNGVERADLEVDFGAGQLDIRALTDSSSLITGELDLASRRTPSWTIDRGSGRASMTLQYTRGNWFGDWGRGRGDEWDLRLSPKVGYSLDVDVGAGIAMLDLTGLNLKELNIANGAGQSTLILPKEGDFSARVSSGVGRLVLEIPDEMAARVQIDRGLGPLEISSRFEKRGDVYVTDDWDTNENRVDLEIDIGVGQITVREP